MLPEVGTPWRYSLVAGALIFAFLLQSFLASRIMSPTSDEPPHIAAGLSYIETGVFRANPQHPPLLKELSALSLLLAGIRWPNTPEAIELIKGPPRPGWQPEWQIGVSLIADNGPDKVMFWARLPLILVATLLGVAIYAWGRKMVGDAAALGALFLYAFDPTVLGHSSLVTTDVGVAAFTVFFFFALWSYVQYPSRKRLLLCGLAMGAALGAKFSAVIVPPLCGLLLLAAARWRPETIPGKAPGISHRAQSGGKIGPNDPCPCGSGKKYKKCHGAGGKARKAVVWLGPFLYRSRVVGPFLVFLAIALVAIVVIQALYLFSSDPFLYITGFQRVNADHNPDYEAFLAGHLQRRFYSYFAAAYLLKEPLASIVLVGLGLVVVLRSKTIGFLQKLFLLFPPVAIFAAVTIKASNMGIRYIIPVLPFAFLIGGVGLATLIRSRSLWRRGLAAVLCVWITVAAAGIYPDYLSYFNETACLLRNPRQIGLDGGTRCGTLWLDDSNVDWGQGMKQLKAWLDQHARGRTIRWAHFVSFPPEAYGMMNEKVNAGKLLENPPPPGLYVVSAHLVARLPAVGESLAPGAGAWLRRTPPTAIVGNSLYVYDVPPRSANPPPAAKMTIDK